MKSHTSSSSSHLPVSMFFDIIEKEMLRSYLGHRHSLCLANINREGLHISCRVQGFPMQGIDDRFSFRFNANVKKSGILVQFFHWEEALKEATMTCLCLLPSSASSGKN